MTDKASAMRESSPPEATLPTGRGVTPAWPATKNSTCSQPGAWGVSKRVSDTSKRPPAMPKVCMVSVTALDRRGAACWRWALSLSMAWVKVFQAARSAACRPSRSAKDSSLANWARLSAWKAAKSSGVRR